MKQNDSVKALQEKMRTGSFKDQGFFGDDPRDLSDIIAADGRAVESLSLTNEILAKRMRYFTEAAAKVFGNEISMENEYRVSVDDHRGSVQCPFEDGFKAGKRNTRFENTHLNKALLWSDLNMHMIEAHGFYEGKGSMFRIEPVMTAEILGLVK